MRRICHITKRKIKAVASTGHIQSSWVNIKQLFLYPLVFSFHIRSIVIALAPYILNIKPKKILLNLYFVLRHINTTNYHGQLFLVTHISGTIKDDREIFYSFNNFYNRICNASSQNKNQLILNFMAEIMIMNFFVPDTSKVLLQYWVKFCNHFNTS
jgi:hypothetical protein